MAWGTMPILAVANVTVTPVGDITSSTSGADGYVQKSVLADDRGEITLELQALSPTNKNLAAAVFDLRYGSQNLATANFTISDPSGLVVALARGVSIKSAPEMTLGPVADDVTSTWVLSCDQLIYTNDLTGIPEETLLQYAEESSGYISAFIQLSL